MNIRGLMKKETKRRLKLIEELYYAKGTLSSEYLLGKLKCSLPALISDARFLNGENLPLKITRVNGLYSIDFDYYATIDSVYAYILRSSLEYQVIECLFFERNRGILEGASRLNCSFSNMQRYLKKIKHIMLSWNITVHHRPLRVEGDEAAIRHFYYLFFKECRLSFANYGFSKEIITCVDQLIRHLLTKNGITNNMTIHFRLMHGFLIGLQRQKQGHFMGESLFESELSLPSMEKFDYLARLIKRELDMDFSDDHLNECLWPLLSHHLVLTPQQQSHAHRVDSKLADFYESHHYLLEQVSELMATSLSEKEMVKTLRLLGNELFCYAPNKESMEILQDTSKTFLRLIDKKYSREIRKLKKIVGAFLQPQLRSAFIPIYISCLITMIDDLLQRLVEADRPINVLLLSDTSTSHERFWQSMFPNFLKGAVQYDYFETPFILQKQLTTLTKQYDLVITNVTMTGLVSACPLIAVNAYPTVRDFERIQHFINHYEPLSSRKEHYNELTSSSQAR